MYQLCKKNVCYFKNCVILCCEWHNFFWKTIIYSYNWLISKP